MAADPELSMDWMDANDVLKRALELESHHGRDCKAPTTLLESNGESHEPRRD